ncbi:MAG TPA: hypothetical protein VFH77_14215 [Streptomyces sp.]|nr:hypothetical protein [Streptomyces sp.]
MSQQQYPTQPGWSQPGPPMPPPRKSSTGKVVGIVVGAVAGFIVVAMLFLGGCAALLADAGNNVDSSTPAAGPSGDKSKDESSGDQGDDGTVGLTDKVTYENGVQVQLADFKRGRTGEFAVPQNTDYVKFTVTMVNGSKETIDAVALYVQCQYGQNPAHDGEMVFDHDNGIDGPPSTHVTPGNSITYTMACVMPKDETRLQVEASPSFISDTALFVGKIK